MPTITDDSEVLVRGDMTNGAPVPVTPATTAPRTALERLDQAESHMARLMEILLLVLGPAIGLLGGFAARHTESTLVLGCSLAGGVCVMAIAVMMRKQHRELMRQRRHVAAGKTERIRLIRQVGELSSVIEAERRLESAASIEDLYLALGREAEGLAAADAALVALRTPDGLAIVAATEWADRRDPALDAQCRHWSNVLDDGGFPVVAFGKAGMIEWLGEGPLTERYGAAMEVPLVADGHPFGLLVVLRRAEDDQPFDAEALQAVSLLAGIASQMILLRSSNHAIREKNLKLKRSIEERDRAQEKLLQTGKLRAVGELVSGVAHELNNPLTALAGYAQLLTLSAAGQQEPQRGWVAEILREAERCSVIVQNLLGFARRSAKDRTPASVSAVVADTLSLKVYDLRANGIEVRTAVPDGLPAPALDRQQLQLVLLNLVNNAVTAMKNARERVLGISARQVGEDVCIEVRDTGSGVPPESKERIFEAFYTTKPPRDGIGLGLTTCRRILTSIGGSIDVESEAGVGSTFRITVPIEVDAAVCA